jgi:hypothetical protein
LDTARARTARWAAEDGKLFRRLIWLAAARSRRPEALKAARVLLEHDL